MLLMMTVQKGTEFEKIFKKTVTIVVQIPSLWM